MTYAVQIKTHSQHNVKLTHLGVHSNYNELNKYRIRGEFLQIDDRTLQYWKGLGMPVYLFVMLYNDSSNKGGQLNCFYKRFTAILTSTQKQEDEYFFKVNDGSTFLAFTTQNPRRYGFARDLFVDTMRCSYSKGSISYISPRTIGLEQFPEENTVFLDLLTEYQVSVRHTYEKTRSFLDPVFRKNKASSVIEARPTIEVQNDNDEIS